MKVRVLTVNLHGLIQKFDEFDLAGFNFSDEQKEKIIELGVSIEKLKAALADPLDTLAEKMKELAEKFPPLEYEPEIKQKNKSWKKNRFYD
jgi:hypothetical protein